MTDEKYRASGIGGQLIKAAKEKSAAFLQKERGVQNPKMMLMTEQNDPLNMTLRNSANDFAGAAVGPTERQSIWGKFGQQLVAGFNYAQVSLRTGLEACEGLGLHVTMPKAQAAIPSDLLAYAVKSYADLALNKQQRNIESDPYYQDMKQQSDAKPSFTLNPVVTEFAARDNMLMAAQKQAAVKLGADEKFVGDILQDYQKKRAAYSASATVAAVRHNRKASVSHGLNS